MTAWFGTSWQAPINDGPWVETPVGERCLYCHKRIKAGDSGILMGMIASALVDIDPPADQEVHENSHTSRPEHRKCFLTQILGRHLAKEVMK